MRKRRGPATCTRPIPNSWRYVVVVHNSVDYHRPVEGSETVLVTSAVAAVGNSSLTTVNVIATADGHRCATVRTVQVVLGEDRAATRPWSAEERAALQRHFDDSLTESGA